MDIDLESNSSYQGNPTRWTTYLSSLPLINQSSFFYKDETLDIGYILTNPLIIVDSQTYKKLGTINVDSSHLFLITSKRFCGFFSSEETFNILVCSMNNEFFVYTMIPFSQFNNYPIVNYEFKSIIVNRNIENRIMKFKYLQNSEKILYFITINDKSQINFLTLDGRSFKGDITQLPNMNKSSFSFWHFSNTIYDDISQMPLYLLNPFSYSEYYSGNSDNNILLILTEKYLKILKFSIYDTYVSPEIIYTNYNIKIELLDIIQDYNNLCDIITCDCYFDSNYKVYVIYIIIQNKFKKFFLYKKEISLYNKNIPENLSYIEVTNYYLGNPNSCLITNKFGDEMMLLISGGNVVYISQNLKVNKNLNLNFNSINPINSREVFAIDICDLKKGILNIHYRNKIGIYDKTENVLREIENSNFIQRDNQRLQEKLQQISQESNYAAINDFFAQSFQDFEKNKIVKPEIKEDFSQIINNEHNLITFCIILTETVKNFLNDDSLNIEVINKKCPKAESVIVEYLNRKLEMINNIFSFLENLNFLRIANNISEKQKTLLFLYNSIEKLKAAICIREGENKILSEKLGLILSNNVELTKSPILDFFNVFYSKMEKELNVPSNTHFSKQFLYLKINHINNDFLKNFFGLISTILNKHIFNEIQKAEYLNSLLDIFNKISIEIIKEYITKNEKMTDENGINQIFINSRDSFWVLNKNHLDNNLLSFYRLILAFKSSREGRKLENDKIILFAEKLLKLYQLYFMNYNNSTQHKRDFYSKKIEILNGLIPINAAKCFQLSMDFDDYYTSSLLFYKHKNDKVGKKNELILNNNSNNEEKYAPNNFETFEPFIKYMKTKSFKTRIFILKQVLKLEIEAAQSNKENEEQFYNFEYFDNFKEFLEEISDVVSKYPKLNHFFNLYVNHLKQEEKKEDYKLTNPNELEVILTKTSNKNDNINMIHMTKIQKVMQLTNISKDNENINQDLTELYKLNTLLSIIFMAKKAKYPLNQKENEQIYEQFPKLAEYLLSDYFFTQNNDFEERKNIIFSVFHVLKMLKFENKISKEDEEKIRNRAFYKAIKSDAVKVKIEMYYYETYFFDKMDDEMRNYFLNIVITVPLMRMYLGNEELVHKITEEIENEEKFISHEYEEYYMLLKKDNLNQNINNNNSISFPFN